MSAFEARASIASAPDASHQRQGHRHLLAAQQVAGVQDEVGHVVVGRVGDEPVHPTRVAVGSRGCMPARTSTSPLGRRSSTAGTRVDAGYR